MTAGEWAVVIGAQVCLVLLVILVVVIVRLDRAAAEMRSTTRDLARQAGDVIEELRTAVRDADFELDRIDALITGAERVTDRVDAASGLADKVITSPVVKAMAVGTGTRRAVQRLTRAEPQPPRRNRQRQSPKQRESAKQERTG